MFCTPKIRHVVSQNYEDVILLIKRARTFHRVDFYTFVTVEIQSGVNR
jgi:hypothetical protein